jgi:hypothetical protein
MMDSTEEKVKVEGLINRHLEICLRRWKLLKEMQDQIGLLPSKFYFLFFIFNFSGFALLMG